MTSISSDWNRLAPELLGKIAVAAMVNRNDVVVYIFAKVCKAWRATMNNNAFVTPVFAHSTIAFSYLIDFSSDKTERERLWRIVDFQSVLYSDAVNKMGEELLLYRQYMTPYKISFIIDHLIDKGEFETVALILQCKPKLASVSLQHIVKKLEANASHLRSLC